MFKRLRGRGQSPPTAKIQILLDWCKWGGSREVPRNCPFLTLFLRSERPKRPRPSGARAGLRSAVVRAHNRPERSEGGLRRRGGAAAARPRGRSGVVGRRAVGRLSACALAAVRPFRGRRCRPRTSAPLNFAPSLRCRPSGA